MSGKHWTAEEIDYLKENYGMAQMETITRDLGRSYNAICLKAQRLGLGSRDSAGETLSLSEVGRMVGVPYNSISQYWIPKGLKVARFDGHVQIRPKNLVKFMKSHPQLYDARKCDPIYFSQYKWFRDKKAAEIQSNTIVMKKWTENDISQLEFGIKKGDSYETIAKRLNRSVASVKGKFYSIYNTRRGKEE